MALAFATNHRRRAVARYKCRLEEAPQVQLTGVKGGEGGKLGGDSDRGDGSSRSDAPALAEEQLTSRASLSFSRAQFGAFGALLEELCDEFVPPWCDEAAVDVTAQDSTMPSTGAADCIAPTPTYAPTRGDGMPPYPMLE
eukprot:CAMPEP_0117500900 /NCGR_PEP_ID=MMETSP0784-20121206/23016_1 /TAXON_ID=39447 /ORGANISM="" /LENGTH=139 /DNA_ID=CAMNT_0005296127 /DNA_START=274 /DNA_END=691 /DNA_ORIENTATION=-